MSKINQNANKVDKFYTLSKKGITTFINRLVREYIDDVRDASATVAAINDELAKIE